MKPVRELDDRSRTNRDGVKMGLIGWPLTIGIALGAATVLSLSSPFLLDRGLSQGILDRLLRLICIPPLIITLVAFLLKIPHSLIRGVVRHVYTPRRGKLMDFALGFIGWFVVNGILAIVLGWLIFSTNLFYGPEAPPTSQNLPSGLIVMPVITLVNIVVLLVLAFKRRMMALGILTAYAVNFAVTLVIGVGLASLCGGPFYLIAFPPFR